MPSITFILADERVITVSASPGQSVMEAALIGDVPGLVADCGGGAVCGTCHIYVDARWRDRVGPPKAAEEDILDTVYEPGPASRLACQIPIREELDGLTVRVPTRQIT